MTAGHHTNALARKLVAVAWLSVAAFVTASHAFGRFCAEIVTAWEKL